jgi:hypothetical protein
VATGEATGAGQRGQAMAVAIQVASEIERRRGESDGGWAGSGDRPRPKPGRLSRALVGRFRPVGQLGRNGFSPLFKQNLEIQI